MSTFPAGEASAGGLPEEALAAWRSDVPDAPAERRRSPRYPLTCPVWFIDADGTTVVRSRTENVSTSGAFVLLPAGVPMQVGQKVALRMALPHESEHTYVLTSYDGEATVVRTAPDRQADPQRLGVGVRFDAEMSLEVLG